MPFAAVPKCITHRMAQCLGEFLVFVLLFCVGLFGLAGLVVHGISIKTTGRPVMAPRLID